MIVFGSKHAIVDVLLYVSFCFLDSLLVDHIASSRILSSDSAP